MKVLSGLYYLQGKEIVFMDGKFNYMYDGSEVTFGTKCGHILMGKWLISYDENDNPEIELHSYSQIAVEMKLGRNPDLARKLVDAGVLDGEWKERIEEQKRKEEEERNLKAYARNMETYLTMKAQLEPKELMMNSTNTKQAIQMDDDIFYTRYFIEGRNIWSPWERVQTSYEWILDIYLDGEEK